MSVDYIAAQLKLFKKTSQESRLEVDQFCHESPFLRTKREVQQELARAEKYRASILKNVTTFAGLTTEALLTAAQSMEEVFYAKGSDIIEQDDIGDSFFVLEEGEVVVTRKANMRDYNEKPRELAKLGNNAHFGEIALLTAEPRSATVTVISETAKCLRMTKAKFEELLATTNKLQAENRRIIGRDVLDTVPLFRSLSAVNKKKLLDAMIPMTYLPSSYICRQATTGNTFFILTDGFCKVTINCEDKTEKEVGRLRPGDFFGDVALMEANNRRTANVVSIDTVNCLTLSRTDFTRLLTTLKVKLLEHQAVRGASNMAGMKGASSDLLQTSSLANKRRISSYNTHGHRDDNRINNLFKRFTKFTTESLWNSLYSRMYREMVLDPSKQIEYGLVAEEIMRENDQRYGAVMAISAHAQRILEMDPPRRSLADHAFILGMLKQRNDLREKLCKAWPAHQFGVLCKRIKIQRFVPFKKIFEIDSSGTAAYLIVRGCVRIFSKASSAGHDAHAPKAFFEQDVGPGEVFGEAALGGIHLRMHMAQSITHVDAIVIDDQDFMAAQDKDNAHMGTEERQRFLSAVPMFKNWDAYKLLRLAHVLIQEEVNKGVVLTRHGKPSKDLYFVVNGRLDVVTSLEKRYVITPLLKHDYIGESGIINKFIKASASKLCEEFYSIAATKVEVLVLPDSAFTLFDLHSVDVIRSTFFAKAEWRRRRVKAMKHERAKVRKHVHIMGKECEALHEFPVDKEFLSSEQIKMIEETHGRAMQEKNQATIGKVGSRAGSPLFADFEGTHEEERAESPVQIRNCGALPNIGHGRPTSPVHSAQLLRTTQTQQSQNQQNRPTSAVLAAGGKSSGGGGGGQTRPKSAAAIVPANPAYTGQSTIPVQKLGDIEDIPTIFINDMDRFMVSITCRTERERAKFASTVSSALRPKSARAREFAAKTQCENNVVAKRADVLAVLEDKDTTRSKLVIKNRRNSAAETAFAMMNPSEGRVRPRTAGELQGRRPLERPPVYPSGGVASYSADSVETRGNEGDGPHVSTNDILYESRHLAMQSGGIDIHKQEATPLSSPTRPTLPTINTNLPFGGGGGRRGDNAASTQGGEGGDPAVVQTTGTHSASYSDDLEEHEDVFPTETLTGETHTPFASVVRGNSGNLAARRESTSSSGGGVGGRSSKRNLSLRGSLCIPMSQSYADTLSRSNITPKSALAMKLEASIDKYIYKR